MAGITVPFLLRGCENQIRDVKRNASSSDFKKGTLRKRPNDLLGHQKCGIGRSADTRDGGVEARVYGTMPVRGSPGAEILAVLSDQQQGCSLLWRVAPAFTPCSKPSPQFDFRPSIKG